MIIWIGITVSAAFGLLCALWACLGFLLPGQKGTVMVYYCRGESLDALIRRHRWLRDMGLLSCRLIIVDGGMTEQQRQLLENKQGIEICDGQSLLGRIE